MNMLSENGSPVVSVIIPTFNRVATIGRAIESALAQSLPEIEVIVVDDASTDATEDMVLRYDDSRVSYFRHQSNQFAGAARNTGMRHARAEYIAFLDSDDEWLPEKLERQVETLAEREKIWGCVYSGALLFKDGHTAPVTYRPVKEGWLVKELFTGEIVVWTPTFMFRRSCLETVGYMDVNLRRSQDRDFYIRMLCKFKLAKIERPLVRIFLNTQKALSVVALDSRQTLLVKHDALLDELGWCTKRRAYAIQWILQAEQYFVDGRLTDGFRFFAKAVLRFPFLPPRRYLAATYKFLRNVWPRPK